MKTTNVRIYPTDLPRLAELRRWLSVKLGRDVTAAEAIHWLLNTGEAQRVMQGQGE